MKFFAVWAGILVGIGTLGMCIALWPEQVGLTFIAVIVLGFTAMLAADLTGH